MAIPIHIPNPVSAALLFLAGLAGAANLEVGPTREHKQLKDVVSLLAAGDTVRVDGNATYTGDVTFRVPGTAAKPIVILGRPLEGKRPVISGGTNTVHFRSDWPYKAGADHYVFQGFEVTGGSSRCIFHQAGDIILRDLVVRDCPAQGILGGDLGSGSLTLEFSEVYNCGRNDGNHQIYMATDEVNRPGSVFRMRHCYVHDGNGGNNVKTRAERNEIHYNWIEGAYYHELEMIGPDPGGADDGWTARMKREDSDVMGNVFWKRRTATGNDSNFSVFRVGGDATGESHGRYRFVNNTIIAGTGSIFRCFDSLESIEAHNNVFHRAGGGLNMMREVEAYWTQGEAVFTGSNNWITTGAANVPASWTGTRQGADPGFLSFASRDLRPGPGSPLLNAGTSSPQGPAGFAFPNPAFPPVSSPPSRAKAEAALPRAVSGGLDIGAYEDGDLTAVGERPMGLSARRTAAWVREGGRLLLDPNRDLQGTSGEKGSGALKTVDGREAESRPARLSAPASR